MPFPLLLPKHFSKAAQTGFDHMGVERVPKAAVCPMYATVKPAVHLSTARQSWRLLRLLSTDAKAEEKLTKYKAGQKVDERFHADRGQFL